MLFKSLLNISAVKFAEYQHKVETLIVLDLKAAWGVVKKKNYKIVEANEKEIKIKVENGFQTTSDGKPKQLSSCILCPVEVHPTCACKERVNFLGPSDGKKRHCKECYNVIQNFGSVNNKFFFNFF
jgi:hypothetical protein